MENFRRSLFYKDGQQIDSTLSSVAVFWSGNSVVINT